MPPKVSVIIPVFNGASLIKQCLESVLSQEYENLEVLVIDDGSSDDLSSAVFEYHRNLNLRLLTHPEKRRRGVSASRALGIDHSEGEYICFLDVDDAFFPGKIARQIAVMGEYPEAALCHCAVKLESAFPVPSSLALNFDMGSERRSYRFAEEPLFLKRNQICNSSVLIRKSSLRDLDWVVQSDFHFFRGLAVVGASWGSRSLHLPS